jgi:hypothetical protein
MEVKANSKSRYTPDQLKFIANWKGGPLSRVDSPESALRVIGLIPKHDYN